MDDGKSVFGLDNEFVVKYDGSQESKDSSGNAVEMANWFVECGGFPNTFPSLGDAPIDFDI